MTQRLIRTGLIDPATRAGDGSLPVHRAAEHGRLDTFRYLMEVNDPFTPRDDGNHALHLAASAGRKAIVGELIGCAGFAEHAADVNKMGFNALHLAAWNQFPQIVASLAE